MLVAVALLTTPSLTAQSRVRAVALALVVEKVTLSSADLVVGRAGIAAQRQRAGAEAAGIVKPSVNVRIAAVEAQHVAGASPLAIDTVALARF